MTTYSELSPDYQYAVNALLFQNQLTALRESRPALDLVNIDGAREQFTQWYFSEKQPKENHISDQSRALRELSETVYCLRLAYAQEQGKPLSDPALSPKWGIELRKEAGLRKFFLDEWLEMLDVKTLTESIDLDLSPAEIGQQVRHKAVDTAFNMPDSAVFQRLRTHGLQYSRSFSGRAERTEKPVQL